MQWKQDSTFEQPPLGTHLARCIKIIDIGTQSGEYQGKPTSSRKNVIYWELSNELMANGEPFTISKFYRASLFETSALRKDLQNWRGKDFTPEELKGFDPRNILGKACQVTITQKESGKHAVTGISGVPKGVQVPEAQNPLVYFSLEEFDQEIYDSLSDGIKKLIQNCAEYGSLKIQETAPPNAAQSNADFTGMVGANDYRVADDDIPF